MDEAFLQFAGIVIGAMIAVGGWLYNARKEREFRKFELRVKYRIETLESALNAVLTLNEKHPQASRIVESFTAARSKIGLFGTDEEFQEFERLVRMIEQNAGGQLQGENINAFPKILLANFRREIGLPPRCSALEPKE
ncbi:hypothetical protein EB810_07720 [Altererythrobacter sp. FM1]|uniref:hypothetical protein n=1 Tax=Tsuneonella flava TaxID=2055955 RepID=UPI000C7FC3BA|nr:hypothetical protein [Tsuneonella flava]ROT95016.1 hypothetical protein EB810_07720 [Altererythrobacter sp. FM1]